MPCKACGNSEKDSETIRHAYRIRSFSLYSPNKTSNSYVKTITYSSCNSMPKYNYSTAYMRRKMFKK